MCHNLSIEVSEETIKITFAGKLRAESIREFNFGIFCQKTLKSSNITTAILFLTFLLLGINLWFQISQVVRRKEHFVLRQMQRGLTSVETWCERRRVKII
jgi:hypothetical protein